MQFEWRLPHLPNHATPYNPHLYPEKTLLLIGTAWGIGQRQGQRPYQYVDSIVGDLPGKTKVHKFKLSAMDGRDRPLKLAS